MKGDGNDQEPTPQTEGDNSMPDASIVDAITNALLVKLLHDTQLSSSSSPSRQLSSSPPITHAFQAIRHASFMPSSSLSSGQSPTKPSPSQQSPSHPSPSNHSPSNQSPSKHSPSHHGSPTSPKYIDIPLPSPSQIARAQGQGLGLTQGPGLGSGPRLDSSPELRCASYSSSEKSLSPSNMSEDGRLSPAAVCSGVTLKSVSNDGLSSGTSTASRGGSSSLSLSSLSNLPPLLSTTQGIKDKTTVMGHHHDMGKMFDLDDDDEEEDLYSFMPSTTQSSSSSSSLRKGLSYTHTTTKSLHTSSTTFSPIKDDNHTNTTNNSNSTLSNPPIPPSSPSPSKLLQFLEKNPSSPVPPVSVWVRPPIVDYSDHITHFVGHIFRSGGSGTISYTSNNHHSSTELFPKYFCNNQVPDVPYDLALLYSPVLFTLCLLPSNPIMFLSLTLSPSHYPHSFLFTPGASIALAAMEDSTRTEASQVTTPPYTEIPSLTFTQPPLHTHTLPHI